MFDMFMRGPRVGWFLLACAALLAASGLNELQTPSPPGEAVAAEQAVLDDLNECTTGVASGLATPDGRPLLWKNRDVGNTDQEWHYVNVGLIPFIGLTYANDVSGQYYAGINAAGFALENSNSYNLGNGVARNGYGYGDDDGEIHMRALSTCRTVDDFEELLDSLVVDGITLCSNYGSFDAFGGAAMFEVAAHSYVRIDAADTPEGFIIRANYSYSGNGLDNRQSYWGPNRHDRAYGLFKQAVEDNSLTPRFIYQQVIRNLGAEGMTDYALPYEGYYQNNPYGVIPNGEVICRSTTRSVFVGQGAADGGHPDDAIIWAMAGNQLGSIVSPLFVRAGSVPTVFDSSNGSPICRLAVAISNEIYDPNGFGVNTFMLHNAEGTGYWDYAFPIEDQMFERTYRFLNSPNFAYDRLEAFQNLIARQTINAMAAWHPAYTFTEIADAVFLGHNLMLAWEPADERLFGEGRQISGYRVFRSDSPFREDDKGELLATVQGTSYTDRSVPAGGAYYRVEAVF